MLVRGARAGPAYGACDAVHKRHSGRSSGTRALPSAMSNAATVGAAGCATMTATPGGIARSIAGRRSAATTRTFAPLSARIHPASSAL